MIVKHTELRDGMDLVQIDAVLSAMSAANHTNDWPIGWSDLTHDEQIQKVLNVVRHHAEHGERNYSKHRLLTLGRVAEHMGLPADTVSPLLSELVAAGHVARQAGGFKPVF
jgi:hypothetical protein